MKTALTLLFLIFITSFTACAPQAAVESTRLPTSVPATDSPAPALDAPAAIPTSAAAEEPTAAWKQYTNSTFGLSFQYPTGWFGPDEYVSGQTLRLAIGSDVVYPYGTDITEQVQTLKNAYYITIQYTKNNQNMYWKDTYQALTNLRDGESLASGRSLIIRVKQRSLGRFTGIEYLSTLSETAQTEPVYSREIILVDEQSNLLTITGMPNNVQTNGAGWREAYQAVDQANQDLYNQILESFKVD